MQTLEPNAIGAVALPLPTDFLRRLVDTSIDRSTRWVAVIWWYTKTNPAGPTAGQISKDLERAGYGRQHTTRMATALAKDRRVTKGSGGRYSIRVTAESELDSLFRPYFSASVGAINEVAGKRAQIVMQHDVQKPAGATRPSLFIGSSAEGLRYARALERQLDHHVEVTIWKDGVFGLGDGTLETLVNELSNYDFAALVLTPDDLTTSRNSTLPSPRDNVLFELGLFMGHLGRHRTFVVYNKDAAIKLPSDLAGVTPATFKNRSDNNYHAQMSPPSTLIIDAIERLGRLKK